LNPLSALYGTAARLRRSWYAHGGRQRWLDVPVVSVGNLVVGGSGKSPVVAMLAARLRARGERPAILSRGYARRERSSDVVVVHDGERLCESTARSGDEPQMLARRLDGIPVLVSPDRFRAGRLAQSRFGATVLLLDDGFQHVRLGRQIDLVVVAPTDLDDRVLPVGRLREPLAAARAAHALLVQGEPSDAERLSAALHVRDAFRITRRFADPLRVEPWGAPLAQAAGRRVVAVAGIARPHRFFAALPAAGWDVVERMSFRDHHQFTPRDLRRIEECARRSGADLVMTTEKDAVRLEGLEARVPWAFLPLHVMIEPEMAFDTWLDSKLAAARGALSAADMRHAPGSHGTDEGPHIRG
jgi:tetraacyldisaccharide 4'-kinase